ncbi:hypothetical protein [Nonomuraea sp. C10]|uniref:hypothetical protein n=1 Tax=Nonomuraea sp. C10 TaxID=2600577 RepID=UPI0011CE18DE|nr:hypothetical protein [Nonomuraea sp. C10]TXK34646.1 hypothetical protein FR742_35500 [Nonomuraea sp. C10]
MLETSIRTLGASAEVMTLKGDLDGAADAMDRALRIAQDATCPQEQILIAVAAGMATVCPLQQALRAANAIKRVEDRIGALGSVAGALSRAGRTTEALAPVTEAELSPTGLRALAEALVMAGDIDRAVTVAGRDPDPSWGWDAFARALVRADRLDQAYATALFLVTDRPRRDIALLVVAEALAASRRGDQAVEVAEHIADPSCRTQALRAAALAIDDPDRTAELLRRAETAARAIPNPGTRQTELRALALACAERGDLTRALTTPDWAGRITLARQLLKSGRKAQATALLDHAQPRDADDAATLHNAQTPDNDMHADNAGTLHTAQTPDADVAAVLGDVRALDGSLQVDVAATMAQAGRIDRAVALARAITDRFRREQALARIARSAIGAGHPERAGEILDEASAAALAIDGADDIRQVRGLAELADALAHAGRREQADELLRRAELLVHTLYEEQERFEAWRLLAATLGRAGLLDRADAIAAARWPSPWPDLVRALCDIGAYDHAYERTPSIPDPGQRSWALRHVAAGHAQTGRLDQAESIALAIEEAAPRAEALLSVAKARTRAGQLNHAVVLLRDAETAARSVTSSRDHDRLLRELVDTLLATGRLDQAAELLAQAEAAAHTPAALAAVLIASGQLDRAFLAALDVTDPLEQCGALSSVAEALAATGAPPGRVSQVLLHADATAAQATDPALRVRLRARLARAWAATGDTHRAERTIDELLTESASLPPQATADLAQALSTLGQYDRALALTTDPQTAATVIITMARKGEFTRATDLAHTLPTPQPREWALAEISRAMTVPGPPTGRTSPS